MGFVFMAWIAFAAVVVCWPSKAWGYEGKRLD
jgi:hypothetical protein